MEVLNAISKKNRDAPTQKRLRDGAAALSARWEHLPTEALHGLTRAILVRAQIHSDRIVSTPTRDVWYDGFWTKAVRKQLMLGLRMMGRAQMPMTPIAAIASMNP